MAILCSLDYPWRCGRKAGAESFAHPYFARLRENYSKSGNLYLIFDTHTPSPDTPSAWDAVSTAGTHSKSTGSHIICHHDFQFNRIQNRSAKMLPHCWGQVEFIPPDMHVKGFKWRSLARRSPTMMIQTSSGCTGLACTFSLGGREYIEQQVLCKMDQSHPHSSFLSLQVSDFPSSHFHTSKLNR